MPAGREQANLVIERKFSENLPWRFSKQVQTMVERRAMKFIAGSRNPFGLHIVNTFFLPSFARLNDVQVPCEYN